MIVEKTMRKGEEQREKEGKAPVPSTEAKGGKANRRYVNTDDSTTREEMERLSLRVKEVDRVHGEFMRVWLMPHALQCVATNRRFSVSEFCDRKSWQGVDAPDHNAQPIVARLLVEKLPQCGPFVEFRHCRWDAVFEARGASA